MQFLVKLPDGRELSGASEQVLVANHYGGLLLLAYTMPAGVIICGHRDEVSWPKYVSDVGFNAAQPLDDIQVQESNCMLAQLQPVTGGLITFPAKAVYVYSDNADPVAVAILPGRDKKPELCHCAEHRWEHFCSQHSINIPRTLQTVELD